VKKLNKIIATIFFSFIFPASYSQVKVINDIIYATVSDQQFQEYQLKLDVYAPFNPSSEKKPVLILVHGGGFAMGDKQQKLYVEMAYRFAQKNFVVFTINYRLKSKKEPFSKFILDRAVSDVNSAIRWIVNNKKTYNTDINKVWIGGDSAGGGLVVNTTFQEEPPVEFIGCIDLWGGLPDYGLPGTENWNQPIDKYLNLKGKLTPVCIVHGTADAVIPFQTSVNFAEKLKTNGNSIELHFLKDAGHYPEKSKDEFIEIMMKFLQKTIYK
jgi:acetyl esterase/lipase